MDITIVICTHQRAALLERTLASLARAARPADARFGLLVVANACSDDTADVLRRWESSGSAGAGLPLAWAEEPRRGKSNALNLALTMLRGDAAVFIDDDHRVDEGFLAAIARALNEHPEVNILCGRILPDWDGTEPRWAHDRGPYRIYPPPVPIFDAGDEARDLDPEDFKPGGGNLIIRMPLLGRLGRFDTGLGPAGHNLGGGEDSEFLQRALDAGERLRYRPDILQYHHVDPERFRLRHLIRQSYQRSLASARIHHGGDGRVPRYLWRKLAGYLASALFSVDASRTRFYLVRSAAAAGEIAGVRRPVGAA